MTENDAQLELKKRARRRLVGAIGLAVLAAVVLPMVMDQEPKTAAQDIQIRIPAQDAGSFSSRILPVRPGATPTPLPPAGGPQAKSAASGAADAKAEAPPARVAPAQPEPAGTQSPVEKPPAKPADKEGAKPAEKPLAKAGSSPAQPAKPDADKGPAAARQPDMRAAAPIDEKLLAKATEKPAANGGEHWVVQIGAYRDPANVRNLQAKLKEQGYNFYLEPLVSDGVKKTRVRVGPFPSKEAAEKARDRLKRIGVDGVVAPKS